MEYKFEYREDFDPCDMHGTSNMELRYDRIMEFLALIFPGEPTFTIAWYNGYIHNKDWSPAVEHNSTQRFMNTLCGPNIFFRPSVFDGSGEYKKANCVRTHSWVVDIDVRSELHPHGQVDSKAEAISRLNSLKGLSPSCVWDTGHGIQAAYLLAEPYCFPPGFKAGNAAGDPYESAGRRLGQIVLGDTTYSAEHMFRMPLTLNAKEDEEPVRGSYLEIAPQPVKYSLAEMNAVLDNLGVRERRSSPKGRPKRMSESPVRSIRSDAATLPPDVRKVFEAEDCGDRSKDFFNVVRRLHGQGFDKTSLTRAVEQFPRTPDRFLTRLPQEVERILDKLDEPSPRYGSMLLDNSNLTVRNIGLGDCGELSAETEEKLCMYGRSHGFDDSLLEKTLATAAFCEHVFNQEGKGVLETPCGAGKSTWAISHIAAHASEDERYIYVVETVEDIYQAASRIDKLCDTEVGRVHGFNSEKCKELTGATHTWKECSPDSGYSICNLVCAHTAECRFYRRDEEKTKPVQVLTHEGFIRLIEGDSKNLHNANVIVDETLDRFTNEKFSQYELRLLEKYANKLDFCVDTGAFFPDSSLASMPNATKAYVYRGVENTKLLESEIENIRKCRGEDILKSPNPFKSGNPEAEKEHATDVALRMLNFFRMPGDGASYAYTEFTSTNDEEDVIAVKKKRFDFDGAFGGRVRKYIMLDASARLVPHPYPEEMPVFRCGDIESGSELATLHVVQGNPTSSRLKTNVRACQAILAYGLRSKHEKVFVATGKKEKQLAELKVQLEHFAGCSGEDVMHLTRGRIKGVNELGESTLAVLAGMPLFTEIHDYALYAALAGQTTIPHTTVFSEGGKPRMPGGNLPLKAMQRYFALKSIDQIYQTIWRTAVRNGKEVEAIIVVPSPHWILDLITTVMPRCRIGTSYKGSGSATVESVSRGLNDLAGRGLVGGKTLKTARENMAKLSIHQMCRKIAGLKILETPPDECVKKQDVARVLGYAEWGDNKERIEDIVGDAFEDNPENNREKKRLDDGKGPPATDRKRRNAPAGGRETRISRIGNASAGEGDSGELGSEQLAENLCVAHCIPPVILVGDDTEENPFQVVAGHASLEAFRRLRGDDGRLTEPEFIRLDASVPPELHFVLPDEIEAPNCAGDSAD